MPQTLADVLGIAPGKAKPNAYELVGLPVGESDPARIKTAIEATVQRLKRSQSETDAAVWKQAAAAVTKARKLLNDPELKSAYDAKLKKRGQAAGKFAPSSGSKSRIRSEAARDPLRGLLPAMDPLAPFDVDAAAERAARARSFEPPPLPPPLAVAPQASAGPPLLTESEAVAGPDSATMPPVAPPPEPALVFADDMSAASAAAPRVAATPARRRRRRGSPVLLIGFGLLMVGMLSATGYGIYTLAQRSAPNGGTLAQAEPRGRAAARPSSPVNTRPADPVMGNVAPGTPARVPDSLPPLRTDVDVAIPPPLDDPTMDSEPQGDSTIPAGEPMEPQPTPAMEPEPEPEPQPEPKPSGPSDAELAAGQAAITAAETALRAQDWKQMKTLAEKAQAAAADDPQKETANQLFEVADLADYYYNGVVKALEELPSGNSFTLTEGVEVGVIESSAERIVLQLNGRPKPFPFDEMPFVLVHKLGSFTMTASDPTVIAAKAVFQALAKKALPADRQQSVRWLNELPAEVNGSHPHEIANTLERLFPVAS